MAISANSGKKSHLWRLNFFDSGYSWLCFVVFIGFAFSCIYVLQLLVVNGDRCISLQTISSMATQSDSRKGTTLPRMIFAIAGAAKSWTNRKKYVKKWYKSGENIRAIVWLDQEVDETWDKDVPPYRVSGDTSMFEIRIARIVSETFRLGLPDVDWFIMGDDDTCFFPDNLAKVLSKYDHNKMYYIGGVSETHSQNIIHSYNMAFGGGGFAISYPLAKELAQIQEACIGRYTGLMSSDGLIHACMSELGVSLTKELGFHQMDIKGHAVGFLAAHPQAPLVSIHHMDLFYPIFPEKSKDDAVDHLLEGAKVESASLLQQSICYASDLEWSFSVSWGYVVQGYKGFVIPRDLETPLQTFSSVHKEHDEQKFPFNTRPLPRQLCMQPSLFYMETVKRPSANTEGLLESVYIKEFNLERENKCYKDLQPLSSVQRIRVLKEPVKDSWFEAPRRSCCRLKTWSKDSIELRLSDCRNGETSLTNSRTGLAP